MSPDWGVFGTVVSLALGSGFAGSLITRWLQKRDRIEERRAAQVDAHRTELRRAYAEFISSYSRFIGVGYQLVGIKKAIKSQKDDAYYAAMEATEGDDDQAQLARAAAGNPELIAKGRKALDDFVAAGTDADMKAVTLLLLEDDEALAVAVSALSDDAIVFPQSDDDYKRFEQDLQKRRELLDKLTVLLKGAFSPTQWDAATGARPTLPIPSSNALPAPRPDSD